MSRRSEISTPPSSAQRAKRPKRSASVAGGRPSVARVPSRNRSRSFSPVRTGRQPLSDYRQVDRYARLKRRSRVRRSSTAASRRIACTLSAAPGSGKTTFCSQFAAQGARNGEDVLYVSMHETKEGIRRDMGGYDFGFDRALDSDRITFRLLLLGRPAVLRLAGRTAGPLRRDEPAHRLHQLPRYRPGRLRLHHAVAVPARRRRGHDDPAALLPEADRRDHPAHLGDDRPSAYSEEHYLARTASSSCTTTSKTAGCSAGSRC